MTRVAPFSKPRSRSSCRWAKRLKPASSIVLRAHSSLQPSITRTLELAGFSGFAHLQLERDLGFEKGATRVTAARIRQVADRGAELLVS